MTTASFAHFPLAIGTGLLALAGRGARWSASQFLRSPMASTGLVLVSGLTLIAGANALYMQDAPHPAPLFGGISQSAATQNLPQVEPVVVTPVARPEGLVAQPESQSGAEQPASEIAEPTAATAPIVADQNPNEASPVIGNQDIADLQKKLKALGLFDGTVDGFYGPKTADAIRAFEQRNGLPRTGAATPQVVEAVRNAPLTTSQAPAPVEQTSERFDVASNGDIGDLIAEMEQQGAQQNPAAAASSEADQTASVEPAAIDPAALVQSEEQTATAEAPVPAALDRDLISDIQRGLARLGFLQAGVNGTADENTARAIRKFQIFNNYAPTGEVGPVVYQMLVDAGAYL